MSIIELLKEDYLFEDENDPSYVEQITMSNQDDGKVAVDKQFIIKLTNYLDRLFPQFGTFDDQIGNEIRNYMDQSNNDEVIRMKKRIHKLVIDEKKMFLERLQRRLSRVRVPKKQ